MRRGICTLVLASGSALAWGSGAAGLRAQDVTGPALGLATYQAGAPVALRGYLASVGEHLYKSARAENLSPQPIAELTFGVLITNADRSHVTMMTSTVRNLALTPGRTEDVAVGLLSLNELQQLQRRLRPGQPSSLTVTLGVLAATWADGSRWEARLPDDAVDFSGTDSIRRPR